MSNNFTDPGAQSAPDSSPSDDRYAVYLGDGAYAVHLGYSIAIRANDHRAARCTDEVFIDPSSINTLVQLHNRYRKDNSHE